MTQKWMIDRPYGRQYRRDIVGVLGIRKRTFGTVEFTHVRIPCFFANPHAAAFQKHFRWYKVYRQVL